MYKSIWTKSGIYEGIKSVSVCILVGLITVAVASRVTTLIPRELNIIEGIIILTFCTCTRFSIQLSKTFIIYATSLIKSGKENVL